MTPTETDTNSTVHAADTAQGIVAQGTGGEPNPAPATIVQAPQVVVPPQPIAEQQPLSSQSASGAAQAQPLSPGSAITPGPKATQAAPATPGVSTKVSQITQPEHAALAVKNIVSELHTLVHNAAGYASMPLHAIEAAYADLGFVLGVIRSKV